MVWWQILLIVLACGFFGLPLLGFIISSIVGIVVWILANKKDKK